VIGQPHPALRAYVREYVGGFERPAESLIRREVPGDIAPVIFNFGPPFRLRDPRVSKWLTIESFVAGAFDSYVLAGATGPYEALQVNFTLLGLRAFVGHATAELTNRMLHLRDVFGAEADRLAGALYDTPGWDARFQLIEREIFARVQRSRPVPRPVAAAYHRITASAGAASIREIAAASTNTLACRRRCLPACCDSATPPSSSPASCRTAAASALAPKRTSPRGESHEAG
jgi:hypothetical protein